MSTSSPEPDPGPTAPPAAEGMGQELLLFGNEEILRGSDNATLVAFAALAFQELRGGDEAAHHAGCIFLLFSVLCCALVHFALGNAYLHRGRSLIKRRDPPPKKRRGQPVELRAVSLGFVWLAVLSQLVCIAVGLLFILPKRPPGLLARHLLPLFQ